MVLVSFVDSGSIARRLFLSTGGLCLWALHDDDSGSRCGQNQNQHDTTFDFLAPSPFPTTTFGRGRIHVHHDSPAHCPNSDIASAQFARSICRTLEYRWVRIFRRNMDGNGVVFVFHSFDELAKAQGRLSIGSMGPMVCHSYGHSAHNKNESLLCENKLDRPDRNLDTSASAHVLLKLYPLSDSQSQTHCVSFSFAQLLPCDPFRSFPHRIAPHTDCTFHRLHSRLQMYRLPPIPDP